MLMTICVIIICMSGFETLSANSQNIKQFELRQKAKNILVILAVGVPVFFAMLAYLIYKNTTSQHTTKPDASTVQEPNLQDQTIPSDPLPQNPIDQSQLNPNDSIPGMTNQNSPSVSQPNPQPSPQATAGIPDGVIAAINSIEANGINGNPYVSSSLDTSNIPNGVKINFDRNSWTSYSSDLGSVNITAQVMGMTKTGSTTFSLVNGTWLVTGYSIN